MSENCTCTKPEYLAGGVFDCLNDEYFTLTGVHKGLCEFLQYTPEEMEQVFQNRMIECIHKDDRKHIKDEISKQLSYNNVFMYENRLITKHKQIRWVWISAELKDRESPAPYFHCIFHDITNTKEEHEKLVLSEQRYEIVLNEMQDIIFELDCRTFEVYYSANFEKKFGYKIPQKGFPDSMFATDIIYETDKAGLREKFQALLRGEVRMSHEYRIKQKDGRYLWVDVHATAMRDAEGKLLKILGIISDIDKRKNEILETRKIANLDPLTGLLNRRECIRQIECYTEECDTLAALLIIDVDNFKRLNDTEGHLFGDRVLNEIARGLLNIFRLDDIISRIGGDEFVTFMPRLRRKGNVIPKAEAICSLFRHSELAKVCAGISCSVGVCFYPEHGRDFTTLYEKADRAMYYAKENGKGQYYVLDY